MSSHFTHSLFRFKKYLDNKGVLVHWQYLVLASLLSFFGGTIWALISITYDVELSAIAAILGVIQGFLAFIYMREKGDPRLITYSILFSLLGLFIGKYISYVHYYDWVISGVVDKSEVTFSLLFFYIQSIDYVSVSDFFSYYKDSFSVYDFLWIAIIITSSMEYQLFYHNEEINPQDRKNKRSGRRIRRRFTGQQF